MPKRTYTPEDIERGLQALAEYGGAAQAADKTGIPRSTLRYWAANGFANEFASIRQEKRGELVGKVWEAAGEALAIVRAKLPTATAKDAAIIFGILADKGLNLGGEPSEIAEIKVTDATNRLLEAIEREVETPLPGTEEKPNPASSPSRS